MVLAFWRVARQQLGICSLAGPTGNSFSNRPFVRAWIGQPLPMNPKSFKRLSVGDGHVPSKGMGHSEGKQLASKVPKAASKHPDLVMFFNEEIDYPWRQEILEKLEAREKQLGDSPTMVGEVGWHRQMEWLCLFRLSCWPVFLL